MGDRADDDIAAALAASHAAIGSIRALPDPQARITASGRLADGLRALSEEAARMRHGEVLGIYEAEKLSLAALAERVGISKARADQIVRAARRKEDSDAGTDDNAG